MDQINLHQVDYKKWGLIALLVVCLFLSVKSCNQSGELQRYADNEKVLKDSIKTYKLSNGNLAYSVGQLQYTKKELEDKVLSKDKQLKEMSKKFSKVTGVATMSVKTTIPKIMVAHNPLPPEDTNKPKDSTQIAEVPCKFIPRNGAYFGEWFEFGYNVEKDSLTIEPLSTWTDVKQVNGVKKKWFLGRATPTTDYSFTNPFVTASEVKVIVVPYKVPVYDTRLFNIGIGVGLGYLLFK